MKNVLACIDGSTAAEAVCDYAAWSAKRLQTELVLMHVLDEQRYPAAPDLSGNLGLGSREALLEELANLDEQRARVAREQGQHILEAASERVSQLGVSAPSLRQRHGDLVDTVTEMEEDTRLLVLGQHGESDAGVGRHIGNHVERVVRAMHRPVLVTPDEYREPQRILIAFDGSPTTRKGVDMVAESPMFRGLAIHLLTVGADTSGAREQLGEAQVRLQQAGFEVQVDIRAGDVEQTLKSYQAEKSIDLLIMGAYGHSRIRQFLVGSTTTNMLRESDIPVLLLR